MVRMIEGRQYPTLIEKSAIVELLSRAQIRNVLGHSFPMPDRL
jgi:hypothetical protein